MENSEALRNSLINLIGKQSSPKDLAMQDRAAGVTDKEGSKDVEDGMRKRSFIEVVHIVKLVVR